MISKVPAAINYRPQERPARGRDPHLGDRHQLGIKVASKINALLGVPPKLWAASIGGPLCPP
jgi:hypothetical protein